MRVLYQHVLPFGHWLIGFCVWLRFYFKCCFLFVCAFVTWITITYLLTYLVPSSVRPNGDIEFQWEWLKFDPSQNPNPVTDYDKTLHNWLFPRDEHVTQSLCLSIVRERLPKYVKYNTNFFFLIFSRPGLLKWVLSRGRILSQNGSRHSEWRMDVPFWVWTMADNI